MEDRLAWSVSDHAVRRCKGFRTPLPRLNLERSTGHVKRQGGQIVNPDSDPEHGQLHPGAGERGADIPVCHLYPNGRHKRLLQLTSSLPSEWSTMARRRAPHLLRSKDDAAWSHDGAEGGRGVAKVAVGGRRVKKRSVDEKGDIVDIRAEQCRCCGLGGISVLLISGLPAPPAAERDIRKQRLPSLTP